MKYKLILTLFVIVSFSITGFILAEETFMPIDFSDISKVNINKEKIKEIQKDVKNKIKEIKEESKEDTKKIKEILLSNKQIRLCIDKSVKELSQKTKKERIILINNYQQQLKSATNDEKREELRKEYLNQLKKINKKFNQKVKNIKLSCQNKIKSFKSQSQNESESTIEKIDY